MGADRVLHILETTDMPRAGLGSSGKVERVMAEMRAKLQALLAGEEVEPSKELAEALR